MKNAEVRSQKSEVSRSLSAEQSKGNPQPSVIRRQQSRQLERLKARQKAKQSTPGYPELSSPMGSSLPKNHFGDNPIFFPRRKKLKGYQKEAKREGRAY